MSKATYDTDANNIVDVAATVTTNANLTGPVTSVGNATSIGAGAITNAMLVNGAVANLSGINTGDQINITGNAATVTTNANLTGPVTSTGNATAIANGVITNAMLANGAVANLSGANTGDEVVFSSGADGLVPAPGASTGRVLRDDGTWVIPSGAGDMLKSTYDANNNGTVDLATTVTTNANLTGPVTSTGNATAIASGVITNAMLANPAVANLSGTNTGDQINITGNAATVTTNANLTGPVTSTGNATAIANGAITNAMLANGAVANLSGTNTGDEVTFTGAGTSGIVPDPGSATGKVLRDDGTWVIPSGAGDMLKSTYDANNNGTVDLATTVTTNANLTGPVTSTGNATAIASGVITNAMLANPAVANLSGTNTGDQINITGNAATVTTNANLTGPVTSVGNATSIGAAAITNAMLGTINTAGKVNGGAITTGTIGGNTVINTTGTINSGAITATSFTGDGSGLTNLPAGVESDPTVKVILGIVKSNGTTITAALAGTDYQSPITLSTTGTSGAATLVGNTLNVPNYTGTTYTAGTGLTLATNTFSVNASQNISTLSNLTANGLIKTSGGTGALSIATSGTDYLAPNGSGSALTNLNASNITSGTLPITNGGTGATTVAGAQVNLGILPNTLISGNIFVGSAGNVATPVALSGDATITNLGALTIANGAISGGTAGKITDLSITDADISNTAAIAGTKVAPVFGNQGVSTTSTLTTGTAGQFAVDATGNITKLNNVTTSFPSAQGATGTVLTNNGLGVLTWAAAASGWGLTGNALADATSFLGTTTAQPLRFSTGVGGVERMRIDESGNVGIGTTSPTARLHIQGPGNFDIANTEGDFKVGTGTHRFKVGVAYAGGGAGDVYMGAQGGTSRLFIGGGNTLSDFQTLTVGGGNVGIGTTGPLVKLSVRGRAYIWGNGSAGNSDGDVFAPTIDLSIDDNDTGFEVPADGQLAMYTNNVERIRISNGGNVGIGTTTPTTAKLVINTSAGATGLDLASADSYAELRVLRNSLSTGDKDMYFGYLSGATSSLHMYSNNSETMTVKAGNVGIGTATPTEKLHVTGNAYASVGLAAGGDIRVDGLDLNDGTYERTFRFGSGATGEAIGSKRTAGGNQYGIDFYTGYANRMAITSGGNVGIGTSAPQTSLDVNGSLRSTNGYITLTGEGTNAQGNVGVGFGGYNNVKLAVNADQQFGIYVQGATSYAGYFVGNVDVTGTLNAGVKNFKIDHPLDPENKYLQHVSIESPDMMNIYNGNIVTDVQGIATVTLPSYFEVLNRDFRYQLTVIGQFAQAIIDKEISGNQFVIKTDKPNTKVSWQVTGIRQDPFAEKNRVIPEVEKSGSERGKYIHPEAYGLSRERGIRPDKNNEIVMPSENKTGNKKQD